jgi:hypothetical protein
MVGTIRTPADLDVAHIDVPASPERIWRAIREANGAMSSRRRRLAI